MDQTDAIWDVGKWDLCYWDYVYPHGQPAPTVPKPKFPIAVLRMLKDFLETRLKA